MQKTTKIVYFSEEGRHPRFDFNKPDFVNLVTLYLSAWAIYLAPRSEKKVG